MKPLAGISVVDFTHAVAGPFATNHLRLLGADVVKIERPGGDDWRVFQMVTSLGMSRSFAAINAGKRSIVLDLKSADGREVARRLVARADVLAENFKPGFMREIGLDWEAVRVMNPRLIYASLTGFGQSGAMSEWVAYDHTIQAMSGLMMLDPTLPEPKQAPGVSVDQFGGYLFAFAMMTALFQRERSGLGQRLDASMLDASLVLRGPGLVVGLPGEADEGARRRFMADRPTVRAYKDRDGRWLFLSINYQPQYEVLTRVLGAPELLSDPRFSDLPARTQNAAALKDELAKRIATRSAAELERELQRGGCPAAMVRTTAEIAADPGVRERDTLVEVDGAGLAAPALVVGSGFHLGEDAPERRHLPALGEHTDAVLGELGYTEADIVRLRRAKVVA